MLIIPARHRSYFAFASRRWLALLAVSVLLHFLFIGWIGGKIAIPLPSDRAPTAITAQLHAPPKNEATVPPKPKAVKPRPAATKKPKPRPEQAAAPATPAVTPDEYPAHDAQVSKIDLAQASEALRALEGIAPPPESPPEILPAEPVNAALDEPDTQTYKVSIPPSAELKYDVQALRDGQMVYGSGKISWSSDGVTYAVNGEASILFFTLLNFKSSGVIDEFGVAPVLYSEKRFRRPETNTHFHRERNTISFSASTATYPRQGGEQDRASIVWQLTGIGRGDTERFKPDAEIELFVAGVRDAASWRVRVIGEEQIEIGSGQISAWHVVRIPKPGSYDQKLDIWLAPQHEWYPVKLRFTENNGEYLDMVLSNLTITAPD
jgi:hypothetical protein